jgi:hypothetical protein
MTVEIHSYPTFPQSCSCSFAHKYLSKESMLVTIHSDTDQSLGVFAQLETFPCIVNTKEIFISSTTLTLTHTSVAVAR